jgi:DNA-binding protein H-NS
MSDTSHAAARDLGPHRHAHVAPTSQQIRTVGQRRREAEEKLEQHLQEARQRYEQHEAQAHPETGKPSKVKRH